MNPGYYESNQGLSEYLLFHYGEAEQVLPYDFGPKQALNYPARCVSECLQAEDLPPPTQGRALDLGCAVGRSTFELARHAATVVGIDFSRRFVAVAEHLRQQGSITYAYVEEGRLTVPATAVVPEEIDRSRVTFEVGDATELRADLAPFDVVLMANLIDRLPDPARCLQRLPELVNPGGQLIITSPYTWMVSCTPPEKWLGGYESDGRALRTLDALQDRLSQHFAFKKTLDLPFLIREHARKYQWSVAQASLWVRRG